MTLAVGRLSDAVSGQDLGTVFAVTDRFALTAFHCVGDHETGRIFSRRVRCKWDQGVSRAAVEDNDQVNDVALLRLDQVLPSELEPVRLVRDVAEHSHFVAPGAPAAIPEVPVFAASGEVTWPGARLPDGTPAIQLTCWQAAAGLSLQGLSGAPVLVDRLQEAAGVVRWNPPREDRPELAAGAAIYATPSAAVLRRWPQLDPASTTELLRRLAERSRTRTHAMVRDDVKQLLLAGDIGLDDQVLADGPEAQIVIEAGHTVIEARNNLRASGAVKDAEQQLSDRLATLSRRTSQRYVGVLTDGAEWRVYQWADARLRHVEIARLSVDPSHPDVDELLSWLEAVLATGQQIRPTPGEIVRKLGASSPSYAFDSAELTAIYEECRDLPTVKVRRDLWAKLLTTASGTNFTDDDSLFVDHTLLVATAKVIGHAVLGIFRDRATDISARKIMAGDEFSESLIGGVIEADFFNWIVDIPAGDRFIHDLARRLTRFAWDQVEHDVMKVLYESIIPQHIRHRLGEYYTPDWLAEEIIDECVNDPLTQRVLDASCGSGTFLFHAVRRYVTAAEEAGRPSPDIVRDVGEHVIGFDVHPVAVTLARVTYLLAVGMGRLRADDRPPFTVPVYLSDSIRWGQQSPLWSYEGLSVRTALDHAALLYDPDFTSESEFANRLRFPDRVIANASRFDRLINELADKATNRQPETRPSLAATFDRFAIHDDDRPVLEQTFTNMCELHDQGKDHIWGYYVRNLARPVWLARPDNRIDVLVGNPPWLAYRFMTEIQQVLFRVMSKDRGLWAGATVAPQQDLSALFVARCIELYLRPGGRFGYVMPLAVLTRRAYAGFRAGRYPVQEETVTVAFDQPWDLHQIKPVFFRQSVGAVFGQRQSGDASAMALTQVPEAWSGRFDTKTASKAEAAAHIETMTGEPPPSAKPGSPYATQFSNGATVFPRFLFVVNSDSTGPLGVGAGRRAVVSRRSAKEKKPWKGLPSLRGTVERQFIRPLYLGDSILPFRCLQPFEAVIPWDDPRLLPCDDEDLDRYPGLAAWWRRAEAVWRQHRSSERLSLLAQLDFRRKLSQQFPAVGHRVVYTKSGMYLAAAIVSDPDAVIDHKLYWGTAISINEARFLTAVLNSTVLLMAVRHLQGRGEHNPRDFDKYVFRLPIPLYDAHDAAHQQLVALAERAEQVAADVDLPAVRFEAQRRRIREVLAIDGVTADIDAIVKPLLA